MKYLVKVKEIFEHTYLVEAESKEAAEEITIDNSDGCDLDNDYTGAKYEARELGDENPDYYDECYEDGDEDPDNYDECYEDGERQVRIWLSQDVKDVDIKLKGKQ